MFRFIFYFLCIIPLSGQTQPKEIRAVRTQSPPKIDGALIDSCWRSAPVAKDFLSNEPVTITPKAVMMLTLQVWWTCGMRLSSPPLALRVLYYLDYIKCGRPLEGNQK